MSQQINLLNAALIRPRDWLSLKHVLVIYAVAVMAMLWYHNSLQTEASALYQQRNAAVARYEAAQKELVDVSNEKSQSMNLRSQEQQLQQLTQRKQMQANLLSTFKHVQSDSGHHVLDYMQGFARQPLSGVWVTAFKVNAFEQNLSLTGRALQPDQVPVYLEKLGQQAVFHGQLFSGLSMKALSQLDERDKGLVAAAPPVDGASAGKTATDSGVAVPAKPASAVRAPVTVIEFEVKGMQPVTETGVAAPLARQEAGRG